MKILVHDYAGHPFQVHLSRELARRGNDVTHVYFTENPGPKGAFKTCLGDRDAPHFEGITIGRGYDKTSLLSRRFNDVEYGKRAARIIRAVQPAVVISGNTPTEAQAAIVRACQTGGIRFVYWLQDFYSIAVTTFLRKKLGAPGAAIGWYYRRLERQQLHDSAAVVAITEDFVPLASAWAGSRAKVSVIENWASLDDISVGAKDNAWARTHGLHDDFTFLYSGTLGLKHNPGLLICLAEQGMTMAAVAEGVGIAQLAAAKKAQGLKRLILLPLQPAGVLSDVLASGDVLVAMIEADAGQFAVPSKVKSYLCAGRPILLAAPKQNLAARILTRENAGIVVDPGDEIGFLEAARRLREDPALCAQLGANGRRYAEASFDLETITDRFERVLSATTAFANPGDAAVGWGKARMTTAAAD